MGFMPSKIGVAGRYMINCARLPIVPPRQVCASERDVFDGDIGQKQTARKCTGGKSPRKLLSSRRHDQLVAAEGTMVTLEVLNRRHHGHP